MPRLSKGDRHTAPLVAPTALDTLKLPERVPAISSSAHYLPALSAFGSESVDFAVI